MGAESHAFQAATRQLLDLMIRSLYTHKEVFLRELISNASDAIDTRRLLGLTDSALQVAGNPAIDLRADAEGRTFAIEDNGIGMSREEVTQNIGPIARSGSAEFLAELEKNNANDASPDLIGRQERVRTTGSRPRRRRAAVPASSGGCLQSTALAWSRVN